MAVVHPLWRGSLLNIPRVVIDLETTGLNPGVDRIVEVAAFLRGGDGFETLVRPGYRAFSAEFHGLTPADVRSAPCFCEIAPRLLRLLRGRILVAHNADFDIAFLRAEFARIGYSLVGLPHICTAGLAEALGLAHESRSLRYACEHYGVEIPGAHTAAGDASATAALFDLYARRSALGQVDLQSLAARAPSCPMIQSWSWAPLVEGSLLAQPTHPAVTRRAFESAA